MAKRLHRSACWRRARWRRRLAFVALIVLGLYRTWRALTILAAPAVGVAMAVAVPAALGVPVSFFSVAALFVVIGAGIDHSVFLFEAAETDRSGERACGFPGGADDHSVDGYAGPERYLSGGQLRHRRLQPA